MNHCPNKSYSSLLVCMIDKINNYCVYYEFTLILCQKNYFLHVIWVWSIQMEACAIRDLFRLRLLTDVAIELLKVLIRRRLTLIYTRVNLKAIDHNLERSPNDGEKPSFVSEERCEENCTSKRYQCLFAS